MDKNTLLAKQIGTHIPIRWGPVRGWCGGLGVVSGPSVFPALPVELTQLFDVLYLRRSGVVLRRRKGLEL